MPYRRRNAPSTAVVSVPASGRGESLSVRCRGVHLGDRLPAARYRQISIRSPRSFRGAGLERGGQRSAVPS